MMQPTSIRRSLLACLVLCAAGSAARGQAFNLDFADISGVPGPAYGAAAAQVGFWDNVSSQPIPPVALRDTNNSLTGVTLTSFAANWAFFFNNGGTSRGDEALMDDLVDLINVTTFDFVGLADGAYTVYTYAWAPDTAALFSDVDVLGSPDPTQTVGGAWPGVHQQGVTYARHSVNVQGGSLTVQVAPSPGSSNGSVNGIQIVPEGGCPVAFPYCTAKSVLVCGVPSIASSGASSASSSSGFDISAGPARGNRAGVLLYGTNGAAALPFQGGTLCINPAPLRRSVSVNSGGTPGGCDGQFVLDMNAFASGALGGNPDAGLTMVGQTVHAQWWGRDSVATGSFLSDGLEYEVCP